MLVTVIATLLLIILTPLIWWYLTLKRFKSLDRIPGPKPLPIIGNANRIENSTVGLLKSFMDLHAEYGPVVKVWMGSRLHLMLIKPEYVEFFLNSTVHLTKSSGYDLFRPWLGDGLLVSIGEKWRQRRKMITPTFHFKILEQFMDVFNKQFDILLDNMEKTADIAKESIEISSLVNLCSLDIICETAFGTSIKAQGKSNIKYVEAVTGYLEIFILRFFSAWERNPILFRLSPKYKLYKEYLKTLHDFTNGIIKIRKQEFSKTIMDSKTSEEGIKKKVALLDMLLEASENGADLSDEDIREECETIMFEGHDTATTGIVFSLLSLAENPEIQQKLYEEVVTVLGANCKSIVSINDIQNLTYLDIVVKESLRMYPPVPVIERKLKEDCALDGFVIPKDTDVSIFLYGMCHNPDVFPDPKQFDPERFLPENQAARHNFAYVPFSAGPRNCVGQRFVLLELKTAIVKLIRKFVFSLDPHFKPQIGICSVLKSKNGIRLMIAKRK